MTYSKQNWNDNDANTPLSADRLNHMETMADEAVATATATAATVAAAKDVGVLAQASQDMFVRLYTAPTTVQKTAATGDYIVTTLHTNGKFIPRLIGKSFSNDYEKQGTTGLNFKPGREQLDSAAARLGATAVWNASGWQIDTSPNPNEIRGCQIKDGVIYHDFNTSSIGTKGNSPADVEAIALMSDGRLRCFSTVNGNNDTAASMVAAGAVHSWSYGPNLVVNGVKTIFANSSYNWKYFLTESSGRTILGQKANGDIVIICSISTGTNTTGTSGLSAQAAADLAFAEGLINATMLDGGGSAQAYIGGYYVIPSSDTATSSATGTPKQRAVPDFITYAGGVGGPPPMDTGWKTLPLADGFTVNPGATNLVPQIRQIGGAVYLRGQVSPASGNWPTGQTPVFATVPRRFTTQLSPVRAYMCIGNGDNYRKVVYNNDGTLGVTAGAMSPSYLDLSTISYVAE